jgi:glycosyltransferase involved in cell wall biosynthesis
MVSTYPPTRCGIATFSESLAKGLRTWGKEVDIVRLIQEGDEPSSDPILEVDPGRVADLAAARSLLAEYRGVIVQHEFGIFGPEDGRAVIDLISGLTTPVLTTLHTVPLEPEAGQRQILSELAERVDMLVVPSQGARTVLNEIYHLPLDNVSVIPHGAHWSPGRPRVGRRRRLLTWGLLGPGKGIERAIEAMALLGDRSPEPIYRVVGQTHPNVLRREGLRYRDSLADLIDAHGLGEKVVLDDGYKGDSDLWRLVDECDVVVVPYDNREQISSGVVTEAISGGKPVIATRFPHSEELLGDGAGVVVDHDDIPGMARALSTLLDDDFAYHRAAARARALARDLAWPAVARSYIEVTDRLARTALRVG